MNNFATFKLAKRSDEASIYEVYINDEEGNTPSEYANFLAIASRLTDQVDQLAEIKAQLKTFELEGISRFRLRNESGPFALPAKDKRLISDGFVHVYGSSLRLYCILLPQEVLVLCGGGLKMERTPQECPNVSQHFRLARQLSARLQERLREETTELTFEVVEAMLNDLTLYL